MSLLVRPGKPPRYHHLTPAKAGWEHLGFGARRLEPGEAWAHQTGEDEYVVVVLGGQGAIVIDGGPHWRELGRRPDVWSGMPWALYLPRGIRFTVGAKTDLDLAYAWARGYGDHPARLVRPEDVTVEIRGGGNATRQINGMVNPGFDCDRLVAVEVYTPSGNWSSYPPHKHDQHVEGPEGRLVEADLDEVYFYKIDQPQGYAYQRVYTRDGRLDELVMARDNDLVLVPQGYHPVVSAHGYTTYYLNFLAGSAHSLANSDDPDYAWIKETWQEKDPRLPLVSLPMESR